MGVGQHHAQTLKDTPPRQVLRFGEAFASTAAERRLLREPRTSAKTKPKPANRRACSRLRYRLWGQHRLRISRIVSSAGVRESCIRCTTPQVRRRQDVRQYRTIARKNGRELRSGTVARHWPSFCSKVESQRRTAQRLNQMCVGTSPCNRTHASA
jgi:hypothetical protein